ncbi:hypothetical protein BSKO_06324 [Bryopsis sp. KO-2023]|nr:hypothetical protein BSKO_06324 [Bryopsis sp. KO-2023]
MLLRTVTTPLSTHGEERFVSPSGRAGVRRCRVCDVQKITSFAQRRRKLVGGRHASRIVCESGSDTTENSSKLKTTMADLDALLGIEDEEEEESKKLPLRKSAGAVDPTVKEEVAKVAKESGTDEELVDQMTKVIENAVKLADGKADNDSLRESVEVLIESMNPEGKIPPEDIKKMKEQVFGATSFWVTEVIPPRMAPPTESGFFVEASEEDAPAVTFRGNMRGPSQEVFKAVDDKIKELFGEKYTTFLVEETDIENGGDPRIVFKVVPSVYATPPDYPGWLGILTFVLLVLTVGSSLQLGLVANIAKLPKETLDYLARPENYDPDLLPPGLETFDPIPYVLSSLPIAGGVIFLQFMHDLGHRITASFSKIKLSGSVFIPNPQLGTFGTVTQLRSPARDKTALWDFAFGGIALGGVASLGMLIYGLAAAADPGTARDVLVPVPDTLLQGSLLLGGIVKAGVGTTAQGNVLLHPLTIAGWCGLTTTALNLLPIGNLDGGRLMLSAYGQKPLTASAIFAYAGLGLGLLGSSLALPFGLFVLICQRDSEQYLRDQVTPVDSRRQVATLVSLGIAILILLPLTPFVTDTAGGMLL